ncbi:MAG: 4Fe-4S binding protein [Deltaproteobacteria bacterium]|nr:4Fe-4S binding protein [Deltaproteobacteria bacterium]
MNTRIKQILEEGAVDKVLAYKAVQGFLLPWMFTRENAAELEPWEPNGARYPVVKLLLAEVRKNPHANLGILVRGCEERAVRELVKWRQINPQRLVIVGQACDENLAEHCECWKPYPDQLDYGTACEPIRESRRVAELDAMKREVRLDWWLKQLNRCIHCHGCRDVCPVCFCTECSLEHVDLIPAGKLPPDNSFHLVRAVHMAGRCIDCGLCEEVCPARIPLRALYKKVNDLVEGIFAYKTGGPGDKSPFTLLGEELVLPLNDR